MVTPEERAVWQLKMAERRDFPELHDHQLKAMRELDSGKILCGGVGTGKTHTALAYYFTREAPSDVYVITTAKKRDSLDWEKTAAQFGIGKERDGTLAGVITVDSWNNIGKYADIKDAFFIFDEQRLVGSGAWTKAFIKIAKSNRWILLSATPGDTWLDYIPVFVANGFYKNRTEFMLEHVVFTRYAKFPKVERFLGVGTLVRLRNSLLVEMPYFRHTVRRVEIVDVEHDTKRMERVTKDRWNVFLEQPLRDVGELFAVMRKLVNTDASRLRSVRSLLKQHPRLIIFYNHDPELAILRRLKDEHDVAEWNGHKHQEIPTTERWVYLVQYQAGAEGWNCIETDAMVFYSLTYSYKLYEQAQGRIDRLDTPFNVLTYYVFKSASFIDGAIWRSLLTKQNFNEREAAHEGHLET